jgi:hypothetical protein
VISLLIFPFSTSICQEKAEISGKRFMFQVLQVRFENVSLVGAGVMRLRNSGLNHGVLEKPVRQNV